MVIRRLLELFWKVSWMVVFLGLLWAGLSPSGAGSGRIWGGSGGSRRGLVGVWQGFCQTPTRTYQTLPDPTRPMAAVKDMRSNRKWQLAVRRGAINKQQPSTRLRTAGPVCFGGSRGVWGILVEIWKESKGNLGASGRVLEGFLVGSGMVLEGMV